MLSLLTAFRHLLMHFQASLSLQTSRTLHHTEVWGPSCISPPPSVLCSHCQAHVVTDLIVAESQRAGRVAALKKQKRSKNNSSIVIEVKSWYCWLGNLGIVLGRGTGMGGLEPASIQRWIIYGSTRTQNFLEMPGLTFFRHPYAPPRMQKLSTFSASNLHPQSRIRQPGTHQPSTFK